MKLTPFVLASIALATGFSCEGGKDAPPTAEPPEMQGRQFGEPKLAIKLSDEAVNESSGLARSHQDPGWFYTHNDSGDSARFWKFNLTGKMAGPFTVRGAKAVDWEDMASAKIGGKNYLYFADFGDNQERRKSVQIYRIEEPKASESGSIGKVDTYDLTYPDGPHNAETFMVNPLTEEFVIVTKTTAESSLIFTLKNPKPGAHPLVKAGEWKVGEVMEPARLTTGGDFSPEGRFVVVRTYLAAYEFELPFSGEWWKTEPVKVKTASELQGEAIAYSLDGKMLVTTSEFKPCPVSTIEIKG